MAYVLFEYLEKHHFQLVEQALRKVVGKDSSWVTDEPRFKRAVTDWGWNALPLPIRLIGRDKAHWDAYLLALREAVFELGDATVKLRNDAGERIVEVGRNVLFPESDDEPARTDTAPRRRPEIDAGSHPPLAKRVSPDDPDYAAGVSGSEASPAEAAEARQGSIAVGIDLGTVYSLIAYVDKTGHPQSIPNAAGDRLTPSVVLFDEEGTVVGKEAEAAAVLESDRVAECVKRDMGARVYRKKINGEYLPPEVISSFILRSLKMDAERHLGPIHNAVITVPAYFEETRRRATMDAGKLAGLKVLDIINEPTAAAIAYGHSLGFLNPDCRLANDRSMRILVFDLGGGTFDVTILEIKGKHFRALATDGDVYLGGKDWDEKLVDLAAERFRSHFREDPRENPVSRQELWHSAEVAKRTLSERQKASIHVNHLGNRLKVDITRQEFEEATAALVERTRLTTEIVLRQTGAAWADIDRIILVGGSTRMPMISHMLKELTGKAIVHPVWVDEAVALGAALYAEMLSPHGQETVQPAKFSVTNVNSHGLGIEGVDVRSGGKINKILIPKNTPLPKTATKIFKTSKPHQQRVSIKVLEGESERPEACTRIGVCTIRNLPPDLPAGWPIEVSYAYEPNGRLQVTAKLQGHRAGVTTDFMRENLIPDNEVSLWMRFIEQEAQGRSSNSAWKKSQSRTPPSG
jgi:molecular chaperone DnaK